MKKARILLADEHKLLMEALTGILEPDFEVVGMVADGRVLLKTASDLRPDVIVLDTSMPGLNGLDAGRRLVAEMPAIKLIYLTMNQDPVIVDEAFRIGASAYLLKNCTASELLSTIRAGLLHRPCLSSFEINSESVTGSSLQRSDGRRDPLRLTIRQREVLQLLAEGRSMKQVAFELEITPRTVAYHKYRMMEEFNLHSNAALVRFAMRKQVA